MKNLLIILFLFSSCVKAQTGILGVVSTTPAATDGRTLNAKFEPVNGDTLLLPSEWYEGGSDGLILEPTFMQVGSEWRLYYTAAEDDTTIRICLATSPVPPSGSIFDATWTKLGPIIGKGAGGAPATRVAHSSQVFQIGSYWYCLATNGYGNASSYTQDRAAYLYRSPNGVDGWVDLGKKLDGSYGWGNHTVYPVAIGGVYYGLSEHSGAGIWQMRKVTFTDVEGTWTIGDLQPSMSTGGMYGGACLKYYGGQFHAFYHFANSGSLPTYLGYASSPSFTNDWTKVEVPFKSDLTFTGNPYSPFTDQLADVWVEEVGGKTVAVFEYVTNVGAKVRGQLWAFEYDGNFQNLIYRE